MLAHHIVTAASPAVATVHTEPSYVTPERSFVRSESDGRLPESPGATPGRRSPFGVTTHQYGIIYSYAQSTSGPAYPNGAGDAC